MVTLVDDEDFEYLNQWKWVAQDNKCTFYAKRTSYADKKKVSIWMHRLILGITDKGVLSDHKDRDGLNNQKSNLRKATRSQNNANTNPKKNGTSKYIGVSFHKHSKKWHAAIQCNKKLTNLGYHIYEIDAAKAYNEAAKILHGEFANLNKI